MAGSQSFDSAYRAIRRGEPAPVYYLTGTEDVLKDELVSLLEDGVLGPGERDFNLDVRSAAELDGESLLALVETSPMLADRRLVVIRNLEQWRRNAKVWQVLDRYVANPSPSTVLVLSHGANEKLLPELARRAVHVDVKALTPDRLRRWVAARAERAGVQLEADAVEHLIAAVGIDLSQLALELEKLAAASGDRPVSAADVAAMVGVRRGETPHDWVAAVLHRDVRRAVEMLDTVLGRSGVNGVRAIALLGTALVGVRLARAHLVRGNSPRQVERAVFDALRAARSAGPRNRKAEAVAWTAAASNWSESALDAAIEAAYLADRALKSTTVSDERGTLTDMLLRMGTLPAAA